MNILAAILVGALAGWLASMVMRTDEQQGVLLNVVIGVLGAVLGGWLFGDVLGFSSAFLSGSFTLVGIFWAFLGSVILLAVLKLFRLFR